MMARPAWSPLTRAMREREWAASSPWLKWPSASRSNGAPRAASAAHRLAGPSSASRRAMGGGSTRPAPAATVSSACSCGVSPSLRATATPPWAQAEEQAWLRVSGEITRARRGPAASAAVRPAEARSDHQHPVETKSFAGHEARSSSTGPKLAAVAGLSVAYHQLRTRRLQRRSTCSPSSSPGSAARSSEWSDTSAAASDQLHVHVVARLDHVVACRRRPAAGRSCAARRRGPGRPPRDRRSPRSGRTAGPRRCSAG